MKEIRMDFETYEKEMKGSEDTGSFWVLYKMSQWLKGQISLKRCLIFNDATNQQLTEISILLNREDESEDESEYNKIESVKEDKIA